MNGNSVVNLTLSVTDQFSQATQSMGQAAQGLIRRMGELTASLNAPAAAIAKLGVDLLSFFGNIEAQIRSIEGVKDRLKSIGVDLDELAASFSNFKTTGLSDVITPPLIAISDVAKGISPRLGGALAAVATFAQGMSSQVTSAIDIIDAGLIKIIEKAERIPTRLAAVAGGIADVAGIVSGVREPITVFETMRGAVTKTSLAVFNLVQELGLFGLGIQAIQQLVTTGPFSALIGQNVELQQQLLATQSTLAATNRVFKNGIEVKDATAAITALGPTVNAALKQLEKGSLELSNVTSKDLVPIFSIVAGQAGNIGASLSQATDLTLSFSAALGTLGIPLYQANQEIQSILNGQIDNNSRLANQLNINSQMVGLWKSQGTLVQELTQKLGALREGNKLAANTVGNLGSNIKDIFDIIQRTAGAPLLDPIVGQLRDVYKFLEANKVGIGAYVSTLIKYGSTAAAAIRDGILAIAKSLSPILREIPLYLSESFANIATSLSKAISGTLKVLEPVINAFAILVTAATAAGGKALEIFLQFKTLQLGIVALARSFSLLFHIVEPFGSILFILLGRMNPLINGFGSLTKAVGAGTAGFLLLGQRLNSIPGAAAKIAAALPLIGGPLTRLIPTLSTLGIGLIGLSAKFPFLKTAFADALSAAPRFTAALGVLAGKAGLNGIASELLKASASMGAYTTTTGLATLINEKFAASAFLAGNVLRAQILRFAGLAAGAAVLGVAFNELILKNKELLKILGGFGDFLKGLGGVIYAVLSSPITYLTAAIAGLAFAISAQLLPTLALTKIALIDGVLGGLEAVLPQILKFASVMSKLGFVQAALATQSFALALEGLVTSAALGTLSVGALTQGLTAMAVSAAIALAPLALLVGGIAAIGFTFKESTRFLEEGGKLYPKWIDDAVEKLKIFVPFLRILSTFAPLLRGIRFDGAIAPTIDAANKVLRDSAGVSDLVSAAQDRSNNAKAKGIALTKAELALNQQAANAAEKKLSEIESALAAAREDLIDAKSDEAKKKLQKKIDELIVRRDKLDLVDSEKNLEIVKRQIRGARRELDRATDEREKKRLEGVVSDLEYRKEKLETAGASQIVLKPIILQDFGEVEKALKTRIAAAEAILATPFNAEALKKGVSDYLSVTQEQIDAGTISLGDALARYKRVFSIGQIDPEDRLKAAKAITALIKQEGDTRAAAYDVQIRNIETRLKAGQADEIDGEKEITRLKLEQIKVRIASVNDQIDAEFELGRGNSQNVKTLLQERGKLEAEANATTLEGTQKTLDKQLELIQRQTAALTDEIAASEVARNLKVQELINANLLTEAESADKKVDITRQKLVEELALEKAYFDELKAQERPLDPVKAEEFERKIRASKIKTAQLTLSLSEQEERKQQSIARVIQEAIERRTKASLNLLTKESQEYQQQLTLLNRVGGLLVTQNKLLEQRQSLASAVAGYVGTELKLLAETSKSEEEKAVFEKAAAVERLRFLREEQDFERQKLEIQIQQKRLEDAQAARQNKIDQLAAGGDLKQAEANLKKKQADPKALPEEIDALRLDIEAKKQKVSLEREKAIALGENAAINRAGEGTERTALDLKQRGDYNQARFELIKTLPQGQQDAATNQLRNELLYGQGFGDRTRDRGRVAFEEARTPFRGNTPVLDLRGGPGTQLVEPKNIKQEIVLNQTQVVDALNRLLDQNEGVGTFLRYNLSRPQTVNNNNYYTEPTANPYRNTGL